jgi:hypothetical protein
VVRTINRRRFEMKIFPVPLCVFLIATAAHAETTNTNCRSYYKIKDARTCTLSGNDEKAEVPEQLGAINEKEDELALQNGPAPADWPSKGVSSEISSE